MNTQKKLVCAVAAIGSIATFLPWISVSAGAFGYSVSQNQNGFHGSGVLYFLLMVAVIIVAFAGGQTPALQKNTRLIFMGAGVLCVLILLVNKSPESGGGNLGGVVSSSVSMGLGLILAFIASMGLVAIPLIIKEPGESFQNDLAVLKTSVQSVQGAVQDNIAKLPKPSVNVNRQAGSADRMNELEKLITWRNEGKISQQEYEDLKAKVI